MMDCEQNESEALRNLIERVNREAIYPDEIYVMNYLKALEKKSPMIDHPLSAQYHVPPQMAFQTLIQKARLQELAQQFGCKPQRIFARLRVLLDQWDGVSVPASFEATELTESDAFTLLVDDKASEAAGKLLNCAPVAVLGYLFDPVLIERDFRRAIPAARQLNGVYQRMQYLSKSIDGQNKMKQVLGISTSWEVLESWLKADVRTELTSRFSEPGRPLSRTQALRELFRRVKAAMGVRTQRSDVWQSSLRRTTFGQIMPSHSKQFWADLEQISTKTTKKITLEALEESKLDAKRAEDNVKKALEIAEQFISEQVAPLENELARVDIFGMMSLYHRFYGVQDALLGNALHYASLDTDASSLVMLIQHAIRYYGYGEFQIALSRLLMPEKLPFGQFGLEVHISNPDVEGTEDTSLICFSSEDNPNRLQNILPLVRSRNNAPQPPRTVEKEELLLAAVDAASGRTVEILCAGKLKKEQIDHLKKHCPTKVGLLSRAGETIAERMLTTYLPILPERQRINTSLNEVLAEITRIAVLSGEHLPDCGLFSSPNLFGKTIEFPATSNTLAAGTTVQGLCDDLASIYKGEGLPVNQNRGL